MSELDELFKAAAQTEKATFKPEYWEQYTSQFANEKKKRLGLFGFFMVGLVFILGFAVLDYTYQTNEVLGRSTTAKNASVGNQNENAQQGAVELNNNGNLFEAATEKQGRTVERNEKDKFISNTNLVAELNIAEKATISNRTKESNGINTKTTNNSRNVLAGIENKETLEQNSSDNLSSNRANETNAQLANATRLVDQRDASSKSQLSQLKIELENSKPLGEEFTPMLTKAEEVVPEKMPESKSSYVLTKRANKLQYNVQFGGVLYNDFNLTENATEIKMGLQAGIEVDYLLKPNLSVSVGLNGYNRKSDGLHINFNYYNNGFGKIYNKKTYTYSELYFVEVPVNLNYYLTPKHRIGVGATFTRLLTTKVTVSEENNDEISNNNSNSNSSSNDYLYHYNTFDLNNLGLNLNYQYNINRIGLNIGYTHGFTEFLNQETFNSTRFNTLSKISLTLKYRL